MRKLAGSAPALEAPQRASRVSGVTRGSPSKLAKCLLRFTRFTEGFDMLGLKEAKALLDQLAS